jgi:hypothetical protein
VEFVIRGESRGFCKPLLRAWTGVIRCGKAKGWGRFARACPAGFSTRRDTAGRLVTGKLASGVFCNTARVSCRVHQGHLQRWSRSNITHAISNMKPRTNKSWISKVVRRQILFDFILSPITSHFCAAVHEVCTKEHYLDMMLKCISHYGSEKISYFLK